MDTRKFFTSNKTNKIATRKFYRRNLAFNRFNTTFKVFYLYFNFLDPVPETNNVPTQTYS
jgi:hypothetical protein